jgi:hypothetical protein
MARKTLVKKNPSKKRSPEEIAKMDLEQKRLEEAKEHINKNYTKREVYMSRILFSTLFCKFYK